MIQDVPVIASPAPRQAARPGNHGTVTPPSRLDTPAGDSFHSQLAAFIALSRSPCNNIRRPIQIRRETSTVADLQTGSRPRVRLTMGANLNHLTRRGNKPRARDRSRFSLVGRKVGAAQAPARTQACRPLLALPSLTPPKWAKEQPYGTPNHIKGLADSPGNSSRKRLFYGQADPKAHS